jgi:radical SAM superfamily enzyme YgiQ (UPF0313 family)
MRPARGGPRPERDAPLVLLVNPWIHDFAAYDAWAKPLGLLTLGAVLRQRGCRLAYIDCLDRFHPAAGPPAVRGRFGAGPFRRTPIAKPAALADVPRRYARYGIDPAWMAAALDRLPPPDLVLVTSAMTYWYPGVFEAIAAVRGRFPAAPVLLGGVYATLCTEHARRFSGATEVIAGPAEEAVLRCVERLTGFPAAAGFDPDDLDAYPFPAFDLERRIDYVPLITSRGCPYACAYCAAQLLEPRRLARSAASVLAEVAHWHGRFGVVDFVLYDDAFLADPPGHALPILEALAGRGPAVRFHTPNALNARFVTAEVARLLRRAGFRTVRLGLETADFEGRAALDRKLTAPEFARAAAALTSAGFDPAEIGAYILAGLPGQDPGEVLRSIALVRRAGIRPILAHYSPIPGTALWPSAAAASRYDLAADPLFTNNSIQPCSREPFTWERIAAWKRAAAAPFDSGEAPPL